MIFSGNYALERLQGWGLAPFTNYILDFNSFSGNSFLSVSGGVGGQVVGVGSALEYISGVSGYASFNGGQSGSNAAITLQGSSGIPSSAFTMIVAAEQRTMWDVNGSSGPIGGNQVFFSNRSGIKGFEVGLNAANKLYVESWAQGYPDIMTYSGVSAGQNIWQVKKSDKRLEVSRFNPQALKFEGSNFDTKGQISFGDSVSWTLGSGYSAPESFYTGADGSNFYGDLNAFIYVSKALTSSESNSLARCLVSTSSVSSDVSGYLSGLATGYIENTTQNTGIIGYTVYLSGYSTGITSGQQLYNSPITGVASSGSLVYYSVSGDVSENLVYSGVSGYTGLFVSEDTTGITGFETATGNISTTGLLPIYGVSGVTGIINTAVAYDYLSGTGAPYLIRSGISQFNYGSFSSLFPNTMEYLGQRASGNITRIEYNQFVATGSTTVGLQLNRGWSDLSVGPAFRTNINTGMNLWVNGLMSQKGGIQSFGNPYVTYESSGATYLITESGNIELSGRDVELYKRNPYIDITGDYAYSGGRIALYNWYTGSQEREALFGVMDYHTTNTGLFVAYTGNTGVFSGIEGSGHVFFNGLLQTSGEDYTSHPFSPLAPSGATGQFAFFDLFGSVSTGIDYRFDGTGINPNSIAIFENGVRLPNTDFVFHDRTRSLISGVVLYRQGLSKVL